MYDIIIIGQGPAGYTAGIYAARRNLKTLIIGELPGGKISWTHEIENYTGLGKITGAELAKKMKEHVKTFDCEILGEKVTKVEKGFKVYTEEKMYESKALIITTGTENRKLNIEGEDKFFGKGVSYCSTCDGPLFKGKTIAIIGGSNSAVNAAYYLADICEKVYLIHRKDVFRAEETNVERLKAKKNIELLMNSEAQKIDGNQMVESLTLKDGKELKVNGVFIYVGVIPTSSVFANLDIEKDEKRFVKVNLNMETNVPGVFAAGDIRGGILQIAQAVGDGATAAMSAYFYIKKLEGSDAYFVKEKK